MIVNLPNPHTKGFISFEEVLYKRRSVREYRNEPITLYHLSQLLWSAQGITSEFGYRTAPSAGALYPLEIYCSAENVEGIDAGIYKYDPFNHQIGCIKFGFYNKELYKACLYQPQVADAPLVIVITAVFERTTKKYGSRGIRYVFSEVGHVSQNIYLQATALGLGTVAIGAFEEDMIKDILNANEEPIYVMPVGVPL